MFQFMPKMQSKPSSSIREQPVREDGVMMVLKGKPAAPQQ
jgi:hypothetical protein